MGFGRFCWHVKNILPNKRQKNSRGINAVNERRKWTRSEMHRDQKPRDWKAFHPLIFWSSRIHCCCFQVTVMTSYWLLVIKVEHVIAPSSDPPYSKQPSARQCNTADPISVLFFLALMSSPFRATKTQLSILEPHFSVPYPPFNFFLLGFSQATGHGENWGEGLDIFHLILAVCCQGVKKIAGSLSSCCHHILQKKK